MSRTIDEKVVEMRFDNQNFESNVAQSMSTLDRLKTALNFSGVENAFSGISSAADKVNLGGLSGALDGVSEKFTALETVAVGALMNIGAKVSDLAIQTAKELTVDQVTAGFEKYAKKTEAVQKIMNATGMEIEDVNAQLERLNWYTDETSYDFSEMVNTIGTFTAAGIDLETAVTSIQGIANLAGVSGATKLEANRAMYNIAQALSTGYMQKIDWKSIENANMATKEFKEMAIQAALSLGTLEEFEGKVGVVEGAIWNAEKQIYEGGELTFKNDWENGVTFANMSATLSKGRWLTNEVLTKTLDMYGAFTNELSEVYDELNENTDITTSQILKLVNQWMDGTIDWDQAMAMTGKSAEELARILASLGREEYALGRKAFAAAQEAKTFREAIDATKDAVSTGFMNVFEQLFGNYEEAKVLWTDLANELWDIFAAPISDLNDMLQAWNHIEMPDGTIVKGRDIFIQSIKDIYHAIRSVVDPIKEAWDEIFPSMDFRQLFELTQRFQAFTASLELSEDTMEEVYAGFEGIFSVFKLIGDVLKDVLVPFWSELIGLGDDMDGGFFAVFGQFGDWLKGLVNSARGDKFIDFMNRLQLSAAKVGGAIHDMLRPGDIVGVFQENGGGIGGVIAVLIDMLRDANEAFAGAAYAITGNGGIFDAVNKLNDKLTITSQKVGEVIDAFETKFGKISDIFKPLIDAAKTIGSDFFEGLIMIFSDLGGAASGAVDGINDWLDAVKEMIEQSPELADFVENLKEAVQEVSNFLVHMLSLKGAVQIFKDAGGGFKGIFAVIDNRVSYFVNSLFDAVQRLTGFDLHYVGDNILLVLHAIGEGVLWLADTIAKAFGWENNPFGKMLENGSGALDTLKEKFEGLKSGDFSISDAFGRIGNAFKGLFDILSGVAPVISKILGGVGKVFSWLFDQISKLTLTDVIDIAKFALLADFIVNLSWVLGGLSEVLEGFALKLKAEAIKSIALAIIMLAGAALLVSTIPSEKVGGVIGIMATAFAGLIGVLFASKFASPDSVFKVPLLLLGIAVAMVAVGKAVERMAGPIKTFSKMDWESLIKGFTGLIASIGSVVGAMVLISKFADKALSGAVALKEVALAMLLLFGVVELFRLVDWGTLLSSVGKMAAIVAVLGALSLLGDFASGLLTLMRLDTGKFAASMLDLSKGLLYMAAAILVIDQIENFFTDLLKMAVALAALVALTDLLTPLAWGLSVFANSMEKLGKGLLFLSLGIVVLGLLGTFLGEAADRVVDEAIDFTILVFNKIKERAPELVDAIAGCVIAILTEVGNVLSEIDAEPFIHGIEFVSGVIAAIFGAKVLKMLKMNITAKDFIAFGATIAGAIAIIAEIIGLIALMGLAIQQLKEVNGIDVLALINEFAEVADAIANIFFSKVGILIVAAAAIMLIMDKLNLGAAGASAFFGLIGIIAEVASVIEAMGLIFAAFGALNTGFGSAKFDENGENGLIRAIKDFGTFASALAEVFIGPLGALFIAFGTILLVLQKLGFGDKMTAGFKSIAKGQAAIFGDIILIIGEISLIIEAMGLIFSALGGLIALIELAVGEGNVVKGIEKFGAVATAIATVLGDIIGAFAGGIIGGIAGGVVEATLKGVANGLAYMGETAAPFFEAMANMPEGALAGASDLGQMILALTAADVLDGMTAWFKGETDYKKFADGLAEMGPGMSTFVDSIKGISEGDLTAALAVADIVMAFADKVPETGGLLQWIVGETDLGKFAEGLPLLGTGVRDFSYNIAGVKSDVVENTQKAVETVIELASGVPTTTETTWFWGLFTKKDTTMSDFSANLVEFATAFLSYSVLMENVNTDVVKQSASAIKSTVAIAKSIYGIEEIETAKISFNADRLEAFGKALVNFGIKYAEYYSKVEGITPETMDNISTTISNAIDAFIGSDDETLMGKIDLLGNKVLDGIANLFASDSAKEKSKTAGGMLIDYIGEKFIDEESITKLSNDVSTLITGAFGTEELHEQLKQATINLIAEIQNGLDEAIEAEEGPKSSFKKFLEAITTLLDNNDRSRIFYEAGKKLLNSFGNGLTYSTNTSAVKTAFGNFLDDLRSSITSDAQVNQYKAAGQTLGGAVVSGMTGQEVIQEAKTAGNNIGAGLATGVEESNKQVKEAAKKMANGVITTTKQVLAIASPSWQMKVLGMFTGEGFAAGIWESIPNVEEKIHELGQAAINGISNSQFVQKMKEIGILGSGSFAEGLASKIEAVLDAGDLLGDTAVEGEYESLLDSLFAGEEFTTLFGEGLSLNLDEIYDAGSNVSMTGADGALSTYSEWVDAADVNATGFLDTIDSYAEGGSNAWYTQDVATDVVTTLADNITSNADLVEGAARTVAEAAQDGWLGANWNEFQKAAAAPFEEALSNLSGYASDPWFALNDEDYRKLETPLSRVSTVTVIGADDFYGTNSTYDYRMNTYGAEEIALQAAQAAQASAENGARWNEALNGNGMRWNEALTEEVRGLRDDMATYNENVTNLQVVMDSGTVAGELTPSIDKNMGTRWEMSRRGV